MSATRFFNSIYQICSAEHVNTIPSVVRHITWLLRRLTNAFPVTLKLSESLVTAQQSSGVYALVNSMGTYDFNNMNLIKLFLNRLPQSVFFDVGANVGAYSIVASEVRGSKVVSLEPHPITYAELKKNIDLNKRTNIVSLNLAASDINGILTFTNFCRSKSSLNRVVSENELLDCVVNVKSKTMDQICEDINVVPTVIKIDVEGHEPQVLAGLQKFISHVRLFLIENGQRTFLLQHLRKYNFKGPLYYHHSQMTLNSIPQKRAEDPVFIHADYIDKLDKWGVRVS